MLVSVLLPAFNAQDFLSEAIESVLRQTYEQFELILINDGSTDCTLQIMKAFEQRDNRVRIISHSNWGMGNSINRAMQEVQSELIVRMDADDIMLPHRLAKQIFFIEARPEIAVASCLVLYVNSDGRSIGRSVLLPRKEPQCRSAMARADVLGLHHPAAIMRKAAVVSVGGYRGEFWPADDLDLWARLMERGYVLAIQPEYLHKYRIHSNSVSVRDFRVARRKTKWVKACIRARHSAREEPSWEEFCQAENSRPLFSRLDECRKDAAKYLYKLGASRYAESNLLGATVCLIVAALLHPSHVASKIASRRFALPRERRLSRDIT